MLAIELEYLHRVVATQQDDRLRAEWPPHPARLYSALVDAHYRSGDDDPREREALQWLAQAPPPTVHASDASVRDVRTHFVPVNDATVVRQTPIMNGLNKVRGLEAALAAADNDKLRAKTQRKLDKALTALEATARKANLALDKSKHPKLDVLPTHRKKQARTFPSVTPHDPRTYWVWAVDDVPDHVRTSLDGMTRRLFRLGHSSSLIRARVVDKVPNSAPSAWVPDALGTTRLRTAQPDQLAQLDALFAARGGEPGLLPCRWTSYRRQDFDSHSTAVEQPYSADVWSDDWIVFARADGPRGRADNFRYVPMSRAPDVARRVRAALLHFAHKAGVTLPESISGHRGRGVRSERVHLAVVPLPYVGSQYADGNLRGVALLLPRDIDSSDRQALLRAIGAWEADARQGDLAELNDDLDTPIVPVHLGSSGVFHMARLTSRANMRTLSPASWSRPSRLWRSATPVALDRNPGELRRGSAKGGDSAQRHARTLRAVDRARATIARACERMKLPAPSAVDIDFKPVLAGGTGAARFPGFPAVQKPGKPRRVLVHVTLRFDQDVRGPLLLGAGRYLGLGLFLPVSEASPSANNNSLQTTEASHGD